MKISPKFKLNPPALKALEANTVDPDDFLKKTQKTQSEDGNTRSSLCGRNWFFTWNNYNENWKNTILSIKTVDKCVMQPEVGAEGTPHIQGVIVFKNAKKFEELKKVNEKISWRPVKNLKACIEYCQKTDTKAGATVYYGVPEPPEDEMAGLEYYPWQREVVNMLDTKPDPRKIYWFWDPKGCNGKTTFCKHLCLTRKDTTHVTGKAKDCHYAIASLDAKPRVVLFSLTRGMDMDYKALETVKDGFFFSPKYESGNVIFNRPHVIVFANEEPKSWRLSNDRWVIKKIGEES